MREVKNQPKQFELGDKIYYMKHNRIIEDVIIQIAKIERLTTNQKEKMVCQFQNDELWIDDQTYQYQSKLSDTPINPNKSFRSKEELISALLNETATN